MDDHIKDFFSQYSEKSDKGNYHAVIALHESPDVDWETIKEKVPTLLKGWYELCQLPTIDRIQFTLDYWLAKLPYHPHLDEFLTKFYSSLDDIGVYLTQKSYEDPFEPQMVYSMRQNRGFYRGASPAKEEELIKLQKLFPDYILPEDYTAFLQIHNGFWKTTDSTGIISTKDMSEKYSELQLLLMNKMPTITKNGNPVDPKSLIPFYESFGMPFFQCFWGEWHPGQEMGNVYYNGVNSTLSDPKGSIEAQPDKMTFPTFIEWLMFYLEQVEE